MEFMFARRTPEGVPRLMTDHPWNARCSPINGRGPTASNLFMLNLGEFFPSSVYSMPDTFTPDDIISSTLVDYNF